MGGDRQTREALQQEALASAPGETLRRTREALNYGLDDMSRRLHLSSTVIDALEEDRYDELPEPPYVRGYLRAYARCLGLDPAPLLARYDAITGPREPSLLAAQRSAAQGPHRATMVWGSLAVGVVLLVLLSSWWMAHRPEQIEVQGADMASTTAMDEAAGMIEDMPHEQAGAVAVLEPDRQDGPVEVEPAVAPAPVEDTATPEPMQQTGSVAPPSAQEPPGRQAVEIPQPGGEAPPAEVGEPVGAIEEAAQVVPPTPPLEEQGGTGKDRLRLAFSARSWTEVYDADNQRLLFDLVKPGAVRTVEGRAPFRVILGDASGVKVSIDGVPFDHGPFRRRGKTARFRVNRPGAD
jgi:cytoskeleton protein RodZ